MQDPPHKATTALGRLRALQGDAGPGSLTGRWLLPVAWGFSGSVQEARAGRATARGAGSPEHRGLGALALSLFFLRPGFSVCASRVIESGGLRGALSESFRGDGLVFI